MRPPCPTGYIPDVAPRGYTRLAPPGATRPHLLFFYSGPIKICAPARLLAAIRRRRQASRGLGRNGGSLAVHKDMTVVLMASWAAVRCQTRNRETYRGGRELSFAACRGPRRYANAGTRADRKSTPKV
jgi:hypothetical protein